MARRHDLHKGTFKKPGPRQALLADPRLFFSQKVPRKHQRWTQCVLLLFSLFRSRDGDERRRKVFATRNSPELRRCVLLSCQSFVVFSFSAFTGGFRWQSFVCALETLENAGNTSTRLASQGKSFKRFALLARSSRCCTEVGSRSFFQQKKNGGEGGGREICLENPIYS